jgi:hypothetical protein
MIPISWMGVAGVVWPVETGTIEDERDECRVPLWNDAQLWAYPLVGATGSVSRRKQLRRQSVMRQVGDMLVWLAMILVVAAVVYYTPQVASYMSGRDTYPAHGKVAWHAMQHGEVSPASEDP